ncbi:MAG: hypothetical protein DMG16_19425 [Acidobacteria bacterium]|nr:MAG: hypothetical protein DMG16_19425 [Acidobacteriota bacterium]
MAATAITIDELDEKSADLPREPNIYMKSAPEQRKLVTVVIPAHKNHSGTGPSRRLDGAQITSVHDPRNPPNPARS